MYIRVDSAAKIVWIHNRFSSLWHGPSYSSHDVICMSEQEPGSREKNHDGKNHYDEEQEVFEVLRVVCAVWHVFVHLAEVALETFSALAAAIKADATVHALA